MSNAADYLTDLFALKPDAPSPERATVPSPAKSIDLADARAAWQAALDKLAGSLPDDVLRACRAADVRWEHDAADSPQDDALDFGADGWPVGAIDPEPCPTCPALLTWQDAAGRWRCERCDAGALARSMRLADAAARARKRWPAKPTPREAPGGNPGGAGLTEPKRSV